MSQRRTAQPSALEREPGMEYTGKTKRNKPDVTTQTQNPMRQNESNPIRITRPGQKDRCTTWLCFPKLGLLSQNGFVFPKANLTAENKPNLRKQTQCRTTRRERLVADAVPIEPVSSLHLAKCREILAKCSEAELTTLLKASRSQ